MADQLAGEKLDGSECILLCDNFDSAWLFVCLSVCLFVCFDPLLTDLRWVRVKHVKSYSEPSFVLGWVDGLEALCYAVDPGLHTLQHALAYSVKICPLC